MPGSFSEGVTLDGCWSPYVGHAMSWRLVQWVTQHLLIIQISEISFSTVEENDWRDGCFYNKDINIKQFVKFTQVCSHFGQLCFIFSPLILPRHNDAHFPPRNYLSCIKLTYFFFYTLKSSNKTRRQSHTTTDKWAIVRRHRVIMEVDFHIILLGNCASARVNVCLTA